MMYMIYSNTAIFEFHFQRYAYYEKIKKRKIQKKKKNTQNINTQIELLNLIHFNHGSIHLPDLSYNYLAAADLSDLPA